MKVIGIDGAGMNSLSSIIDLGIVKQSEMAFEFIQRIEPLIISKRLVPAKKKILDIDWEGIIPLDYLYWVTEYGSGSIELASGTTKILCIQEIVAYHDETDYSQDDPADAMIDMTIMNDLGMCPVIETEAYSNFVGSILDSSWPMYLIGQLLNLIKI